MAKNPSIAEPLKRSRVSGRLRSGMGFTGQPGLVGRAGVGDSWADMLNLFHHGLI
jgi:hypothetical protein